MAEIFEEFDKDLSNWTIVKNSITRSILNEKMRITGSTTASSGWIESSMKWNAVNFLEHKNFSLEFQISISNNNAKSFGIMTIDLVDATSKNLASVEFYDNSGSDTSFPLSEFRINGARSRFSVPKTNVTAKYKMDYKNGVMVIYQNDVEMFSGEVEGISHLLLRVNRLGIDPWFNYVEFDYFRFKSNVDKSLILHKGEYKRWNEEVPAEPEVWSDDKINLVTKMTSNSSGGQLAFWTYKTDKPGAGIAYNVFDYAVGTEYSGISRVGSSGVIGIIFPKEVTVARYEIEAHNIATYAPRIFTIEGSNDTTTGLDGTWTVIDSRTGIYFAAKENKSFELNVPSTFKAFRLNIAATNHTNTGFAELRFFPPKILLEEAKPRVPAHWSEITITSSTVEEILKSGMEQLSPLMDRVINEFDPIPMVEIEL